MLITNTVSQRVARSVLFLSLVVASIIPFSTAADGTDSDQLLRQQVGRKDAREQDAEGHRRKFPRLGADPKTVLMKQQEPGSVVGVGAGAGSGRNQIAGLVSFADQEVATMGQILERFPFAFHANTETLQKMAANARANPSPSYNPPTKPLLNLGMPKAGSTTLTSFLKCSGYKACHYVHERLDYRVARPDQANTEYPPFFAICMHEAALGRNYENAQPIPLLKSCGYPALCDAYLQMDFIARGRKTGIEEQNFCVFPQHEYLQQLVEEAPTATLVLPFRRFEEWIDSSIRMLDGHGKLLKTMDGTCPYFGLDAFTTGSRSMLEVRERQQAQQLKFLAETETQDTKGDEQFAVITKQLANMRGKDVLARVALFYVYHVTYVRRFAAQHPSLTLLEYSLEDEDTESILEDIFRSPKENQCWGRENINTKHPKSTEETN